MQFLLAFPQVYGTLSKIQMNVVALASTSVKLTSPVSGVNRSIWVDQSSGAAVDLPLALEQTSPTAQKYVLVESNANISVRVVQFVQGHTSDGYLAIPTTSYAKSYIFTCNQGGALSLASLNDNILVTISGGSSENLQKLHTYQRYQSLGVVNASEGFMFIYGSNATTSYSNYRTSYLEVGVPNNDNQFIFIVPMFSGSTDQAVICKTFGNLNISSSLIRGQFSGSYVFINRFTSAQFIYADKSAHCTYEGHGFSTIIPPVTSYTNFYRFLTPSVTTFTHHAAIMVLSSNKDGIRVDQSLPNIAKEETVVVQSTYYSVLYLNITSGQHDITHVDPSVSFGVILYGFGVSGTGSYAYPGGFKFT